jgi:hypothetical protein
MSRFGNTTSTKCSNNCKFANTPVVRRQLFTHNRNWDTVRNNIDIIINNSAIVKKQQELEPISDCNELPVIYDCNEDTATVEVEKVIEVIAEELKITEEKKVEEIPIEKPKRKFQFASVVLQYRNELAKRKYKEISDEQQQNNI